METANGDASVRPPAGIMDPFAWAGGSIGRRHALPTHMTGSFRAVQLLLGHTKIESKVPYLGIDVDDALMIAEQIEI
jgi:hypothetical protein